MVARREFAPKVVMGPVYDTARWPKRRSLAVRACGALAALALVAGCSAIGTPDTSDGPAADGRPECVGPATARSEPSVEVIATDPEPRLPVTYTDITGKPVTITDASRILALDMYGTLATTVYALGLGDRLVGRDVSTGLPELRHLPLVTRNGHELNGEAILDLRPSVILTDYSIGPLEVQLQLRDSGIPVVIMSDQRSRDLIGPQIEAVAEALGVPRLGERLAARVRGETEAAQARVAELAPADPAHRLRMVFLYMRGNAGVYYWFGKGSGADDLIHDLGGIDVATEAGLSGMRPLNAEGLATANPDLYLMMTHGLESVGGIDGLRKVPGVADTSAGAHSCVVDMSDYQILSFGPQFPATLQALAEAIYRQAIRP
ncbi:ABC transporter substrate-binding protein [Phytohabitans sp. ZYX-F-186]|uniref:ABC transporter substrate-binding protein n=1 Tax=Phytohabitans maris TaxID=3071409 RepID=A0ABU0ZLY5_9ACTN|nr:ABC transporter substrate-binding protein [Phytohabitans sp. ZYX-F-186]MDQ7908055.1 ABC transporter substrate-binding protein [Phytohabitans sp. ZYX-F-186]